MKSIFEQIIDGEIPSYKVFEDESFIAILDAFPKTTGHTLLIPKNKKESILVEDVTTQESLITIGSNLAKQIKDNLGASGVRLQFNTGKSAGQVVFHTHLHIIPFYDEEVEAMVNEKVLEKIRV